MRQSFGEFSGFGVDESSCKDMLDRLPCLLVKIFAMGARSTKLSEDKLETILRSHTGQIFEFLFSYPKKRFQRSKNVISRLKS